VGAPTTQYGHVGGITGSVMRSRIRAPNPALNVPQRHEEVGTDVVYRPHMVQAVDDRSTCAIVLIGRKSNFRAIHPSGNSDAQFVASLENKIQRREVPNGIVSDRGTALITRKVEEVLRMYCIKDWQSEPHKHYQNFTEKSWGDWKEKSNMLLNQSGAPDKCWLLALKSTAFLLNHVASEKLGWRTHYEWVHEFTPDISVLLQFTYWKPILYREEEARASKTSELFGRWVGISEDIGHKMTYLVLSENDKVLRRSDIRIAIKDGVYVNQWAEEKAEKYRSIEPRV
jgi:hypothetical protein